MSNKIKIIIIILLILLVTIILIIVPKNPQNINSENIPKEYIGIRYAILKDDYCSCLTFLVNLVQCLIQVNSMIHINIIQKIKK